MNVLETPISDLLVIEPAVFRDSRGYFLESYSSATFKSRGLDYCFVQDNQSLSTFGTLRGFHFQAGEMAQAKLVRVAQGRVLDVVVDLRSKSPTFGKTFSIELTGENLKQLLIPRGFGHAILSLSETAVFCYKCDNFYSKDHDRGIRFDDPDIGFDWPLPAEKMLISEKDQRLPYLHEIKGLL